MMVADAWSALGGVASVVAGAAALVTVLYARQTVREARKARADAHRDHLEAIDAQSASAERFVSEQQFAAAAFVASHEEEMEERQAEHEAELRLQRVLQVERIADTLQALADVARDERVNPPPQLQPPMPFRATRIPVMLKRLAVHVATLRTLGGPELQAAAQLAQQGYGGENPMPIVSSCIDALWEIEQLVATDESLRRPSAQN